MREHEPLLFSQTRDTIPYGGHVLVTLYPSAGPFVRVQISSHAAARLLG
jgi:hypothetical protein